MIWGPLEALATDPLCHLFSSSTVLENYSLEVGHNQMYPEIRSGSMGKMSALTPQEGSLESVRMASSSYRYSLSDPQGTRLTLAAAVTCCTITWSLWHLSGRVSFSVISLIPVSLPRQKKGQSAG